VIFRVYVYLPEGNPALSFATPRTVAPAAGRRFGAKPQLFAPMRHRRDPWRSYGRWSRWTQQRMELNLWARPVSLFIQTRGGAYLLEILET